MGPKRPFFMIKEEKVWNRTRRCHFLPNVPFLAMESLSQLGIRDWYARCARPQMRIWCFVKDLSQRLQVRPLRCWMSVYWKSEMINARCTKVRVFGADILMMGRIRRMSSIYKTAILLLKRFCGIWSSVSNPPTDVFYGRSKSTKRICWCHIAFSSSRRRGVKWSGIKSHTLPSVRHRSWRVIAILDVLFIH